MLGVHPQIGSLCNENDERPGLIDGVIPPAFRHPGRFIARDNGNAFVHPGSTVLTQARWR
jgi:hypothetical protein